MACGQQTYDQKLQSLYKNTVPLVQPHEVKQKLNQQDVVILDTRSAKEYSVSHLPNAKFIDYDRFDISQEGEITDSVHTYNKRWSKWLEEGKGIKVYE